MLITLIWGVTFAGIAVAHLVAASMDNAGASTVFDWVVPIALAAVAAHRSRVCWDDFNDDELFQADPMRDLALDWDESGSD